MKTVKNLKRRSRHYTRKPKLKFRDKARPEGCTYNFEVRLLPVENEPTYIRYGIPLGTQQRQKYQELVGLLETVKEMAGQYKIVRNVRRNTLTVRVQLATEAEVILMMLANRKLIYRVYRYV